MKIKHAFLLLFVLTGCTRAYVGPYVQSVRVGPDGHLQMRKCMGEITILPIMGVIDDDQECEEPLADRAKDE